MKDSIVYIDNTSLNPYFNFGLEYYLTTEKTFPDSTVIMLWRTSPTLMIGKFQNTLAEINKSYAKEKGIQIVRRMSGGGTIYTDLGGWQFSFITKNKGQTIGFEEYTGPVIRALAKLGIHAEYNGRNDLTIDGKKFSGNAQYMHGGYTVHHGSLLYATNIEEMVKSTTVDEYKIISKGIKSVRDRVTNISDHLKEPMAALEFKQAMVDSFMEKGGEVYVLNQEDIHRCRELAAQKFDNWECIYGREPQFNMVRHGHFEGGNIEFRLDIKRGRITDAGVFGDFFGSIEPNQLSEALIGCRYESKEIRQALKKLRLDEGLYKISFEEMVDCIVQ